MELHVLHVLILQYRNNLTYPRVISRDTGISAQDLPAAAMTRGVGGGGTLVY